jgi:Domain of unknown function (DUF4338)
VGEHLKYLVWAKRRPLACLAWSSAARHLGSRDRYLGWGAPAQPSPGGLQHALSEPAVDSGPASGLAHFGAGEEFIVARLETDLWSSDLFRQDLHRSRSLSRYLLARRQLAIFGHNHGARQGLHEQTPHPFL